MAIHFWASYTTPPRTKKLYGVCTRVTAAAVKRWSAAAKSRVATGRWNRIRAAAAWSWPRSWPGCSRCCRRRTPPRPRHRHRRPPVAATAVLAAALDRRRRRGVARPSSRRAAPGPRPPPAEPSSWCPSGNGPAARGYGVGTVSCWRSVRTPANKTNTINIECRTQYIYI